MSITTKFEDHSKEVIKNKDQAIEKALEMIGLQCEKYAKMNAPTDTGLLKNSITHAVSGHGTSITSYKANKPKAGGKNSGSYSGTIGSDKEEAVYVGTNVEYAPYQEYGTYRMKAQPFLKPAINDHLEQYKNIANSCLSQIK